MKPINKNVFRAYDIRGVVDEDFDPEWVFQLGLTTGTYFQKNGWTRAVIGHDVRASSPEYTKQLANGLRQSGVHVLLIGSVSTPVFYFAIRHLNLSAGVMITASHNPAQYNGFKIWGGKTVLQPEHIAQLYEIMRAGNFSSGAGLASSHDILPAYTETLSHDLHYARPVRVVVDGGNGASGTITADLLERCGAEVIRLYCEPDPAFPNHHPDPVVESNMTDLMSTVLATQADLGVGLDGDGDRIGVVDEQGKLLHGDRLAAIFAREILSKHPGATLLGDIKCTDLYFKEIEKCGGKAIMVPTGHSTIKAKMLEHDAQFCGELSGHMYFGDEFRGVDDATWAALCLVSYVADKNTPLSTWLADWPTLYATREINVSCPDHKKFTVIHTVSKELQTLLQHEDCTITDLDGIRITYKDGWCLARASNTQPVIVIRAEATSESRKDELCSLLEEKLKQHIAHS